MASSKYYAYYIRGRKIALIQHDFTLGSGQTLSQPGLNSVGARGDVLWKSPTETITEGLEIEYAYSPKYSITTAATTQVNKFYINGWTVIDGYLTFLRSHSASVPTWDGSPYSAVGDNEHIVVRGSSRWSGLHKVKAGGTDGTLQTYAKVHQSVAVVSGSSNIWLNALFSTNDYIFVTGSAVAKNNGFWQISGVQADSSAESSSGLYVTNRYFCYDGDNTLSTEGEDTSPDTTLATDESVSIYKVYRDFCYLQADINALVRYSGKSIVSDSSSNTSISACT